jgi:transcriptional regulator with XRE-family HTH domain
MNYRRIKTELERRNLSIKELCRRIEVSEQGLHQMIRKQSMKLEVLERISRVLNVDMAYWFREDLEDEVYMKAAEPRPDVLQKPETEEVHRAVVAFHRFLTELGVVIDRN